MVANVNCACLLGAYDCIQVNILQPCFSYQCVPFSEPSSPPVGVQVRADSSESITVLWDEPESTNGGIRNYSVLCLHNQSQEIVVNETVFEPQPVSRFFLEPNSTYSCQVVAYNDHGVSLAQQAVGTTLPVSSENVCCQNLPDNYHCHFSIATAVASLLLVVYADGVEYAELTASAIQSRMLRYERLLNTTEDTKIRGLFAIVILGVDNAIHFVLIL